MKKISKTKNTNFGNSVLPDNTSSVNNSSNAVIIENKDIFTKNKNSPKNDMSKSSIEHSNTRFSSKKKCPIILDILIPIIIGIVLYFIFSIFFILSRVNQTSMVPELNENDIILSSKNNSSEQYQRGDIVIFKTDGTLVVKRIIGLPGESINIQGGKTYINGQAINETYLSSNDNATFLTITIPNDSYFCMGDNRAVSMDSRSFGPVEHNKIIGKVICRLFPDYKIF